MTVSASELTGHETSGGGEEPGGEPVAKIAGRSPFQLAARRFRRDRLSMIAFLIVVFYFVAALLAPILMHFGVLDPYSPHPKLLDANLGGIPFGNWGGISWSHPFGVEPGTGRDVLSRVWLGLTLSLTIAITGTMLTIGLGTVMGIISGFTGGFVDSVIGRIIDLTLSFPVTLMLLALSASLTAQLSNLGVPNGPNKAILSGTYIVLVLSLFGWPPIARIVRGQVLSIREREFVDAAILFGASKTRIYFKEILPNLWAPLLVYFTLTMPAFISAEAALSFLSVGIKSPTPTLGNVLTDSVNFSIADFTFFIIPAVMIALIVVAFNLLGDGMRDALDPKSHR
jgi:peptide/nickel transport system permease protein